MLFKVELDSYEEKVVRFSWPRSSLTFHFVSKDVGYKCVKEGVYILMDKFRRRFYIGETGRTKGGGIYNRLQCHKHERKWWDYALIIEDFQYAFSDDGVRRYYEWILNKIAKERSLKDSVIMVDSSAGEQDAPYDSESSLNTILAACQLIGIPWAFKDAESRHIECGELKATPSIAPVNDMVLFWEGLKKYAKANNPSVGKYMTQKGLPQQWFDVHVGHGKCHIVLGVSVKHNWTKIGVWVHDDKKLKQTFLDCAEEIRNALGEGVEIGGGGNLSMSVYHDIMLTDRANWVAGFAWYIEKFPALLKAVRTIIDGPHLPGTMKDKGCRTDLENAGVTQLAKAIAEKHNGGRAVGHAVEILSGRFPVKHGKWREILTKVGVEFDETGHVVDWSKAKV